jgi:hypothetical protein
VVPRWGSGSTNSQWQALQDHAIITLTALITLTILHCSKCCTCTAPHIHDVVHGTVLSHHYPTLYHCTTVPLYHWTTEPLHHWTTVSLHHCITAPLHHCTTASLNHCTNNEPPYHCTTVSLNHWTTARTTEPLYHCITAPLPAPLNHWTIEPLHHWTTTPLHHCTSTRPPSHCIETTIHCKQRIVCTYYYTTLQLKIDHVHVHT